MFKHLNLKKNRSTQAGLCDFLNYSAIIEDGIILNKDGSLMAGWIYKAPDSASATDEERNILAVRLNQAFSRLGAGWMLHIDAVRKETTKYSNREYSHFPDEVTAAIDQERRLFFENRDSLYEGYFILTITYLPPSIVANKFTEMMFDDDAPSLSQTEQTKNIITKFNQEINALHSVLSNAVKLTRLKSKFFQQEDGSKKVEDTFLSWMNYCVTGKYHPIALPETPLWLDSLIGRQELYGGITPKIGEKFIQVVAIDGLPLESSPGVLNSLAELPISYRWSNRLIFLDQSEAKAHLEKYRRKWKQKTRGFVSQILNLNSNVDQDAVSMVDDASDAIQEISSGHVNGVYYTSVIVIMSKKRSDAKKAAEMAVKLVNRLGFGARIESINTMDAFFGSLPGHGTENVRRPLINSLNAAHLIPTSTVWTGLDHAPCPFYPEMAPPLMSCVTTGRTPFRLNLHVRDLGHTFLFGPTGAGKSVHIALIAAQLRRYNGMTIFAFDKGFSLYPLCSAINSATKGSSGKHFVVGDDETDLTFAPLQFLDSASEQAWAAEWIETILRLNNLEMDPDKRKDIADTIKLLSQSEVRNITAFTTMCQDEEIRKALSSYDLSGVMAHLISGNKDGLDMSDFNVFEIEELMNLDEKYSLPILLYLFRRIERSLKGQPAAILLDEAWIMLGHPVFREKIREWFKVLRKANCLVLLATQSLSDAANSGILDVIVESTATKIFLPNAYAKNEETAALYRKMGLNNKQIDIIASAVPKRDYYYVSEQGRRLYRLEIGPLASCFVANSDKDTIMHIKKLKDVHGDGWYHEWLRENRLNISAYRV